jgi:glycosyltransferase involved in cell wall biosynthesis
MTPFAKLLGLKVIVTNHGPDYDRKKWGKLAKKVLKTGERLGTKFADEVIVISEVIRTIIKNKYNREDTHLIYNGVNLPTIATEDNYITKLGLNKNKYIIGVGRFVEEKGFLDLIEAYSQIDTNVKLVLVGDADHETNHSKLLKEKAIKAGVILTGFIKGGELNQIFSHALLFCMPSYHEGLPIALLEAMSYNLNVLVSDIPANLEVKLAKQDYFKVGNIDELQKKLQLKINTNQTPDFNKKIKNLYNWDIIAENYLDLILA